MELLLSRRTRTLTLCFTSLQVILVQLTIWVGFSNCSMYNRHTSQEPSMSAIMISLKAAQGDGPLHGTAAFSAHLLVALAQSFVHPPNEHLWQ